MLTKRPIDRRHTAALILLTLAVVGLFLSVLVSPAAADLPNLSENRDGTRTVTWRMNTTDGLTLQGVDLANGNVTLPWRQHNLTWADPSEFETNATSDANLSYDAGGVVLRADASNHVADGDFSIRGPWSYGASSDRKSVV